MSSCCRREHVCLLNEKTLLLVGQEDMSSCWTRNMCSCWTRKHVFLLKNTTWEPSGRHLGGSRRLQEAPGGSRKLQEAPGGSRRLREVKSDTPLSYNAKSSPKCQYYILFLRVPFALTAYLQQDLLAGSVPDPAYLARPLYQDRENPYSWRLFGELHAKLQST